MIFEILMVLLPALALAMAIERYFHGGEHGNRRANEAYNRRSESDASNAAGIAAATRRSHLPGASRVAWGAVSDPRTWSQSPGSGSCSYHAATDEYVFSDGTRIPGHAMTAGGSGPLSIGQMGALMQSSLYAQAQQQNALQNAAPHFAPFLAQGMAMPAGHGHGTSLTLHHTIAGAGNCAKCGAAHARGQAHVCEIPTRLDLDVVRTIQTLAAQGLSPEEICGDMGVPIGWRLWSVTPHGLRGLGTGSVAPWHTDLPTMRICAATGCNGSGASCGRTDKPICRIHALKKREASQAELTATHVFGQVALWGDVIECTSGYLATRAYPVGFESSIWARAYRVAVIEKAEGAST